ncbi:FixH family protein [Roseiconus nitratireducens]|uniref:FixH family protein n=1 Tax=Roseiconus nitratireducens TaxID=2605748 RepID=A0A5M6D9P1_9BACT|nr:FixH family protein [Roseiconus nitratireducens]KAA5543150.1 FixH family protein [Roseiconus nitratireducens]
MENDSMRTDGVAKRLPTFPWRTEFVSDLARRSVFLASVGLLALMTNGCSSDQAQTVPVNVDLTFEPAEPMVGDSKVDLRLTDPSGNPIENAAVTLEGNMNHAGMKPSFSELSEQDPGHYSGTLEFTMGGDWFVLVDVEMPDGTTAQQQIDVPGVKVP